MSLGSNKTGKYLSLLAAVMFSLLSAAHVARAAENAGLSVVYGLTLADICGADAGETGGPKGECPNCDLVTIGAFPAAENLAVPICFQSGGLSFEDRHFSGGMWRWSLFPARAPPVFA